MDINNTVINLKLNGFVNAGPLVFSQDEFIINYTGGHIKGTYTVDSEMKISLTSTGDITNISITNGNISFNISIDTDDIIDFSSFKKGIQILKKYKVN